VLGIKYCHQIAEYIPVGVFTDKTFHMSIAQIDVPRNWLDFPEWRPVADAGFLMRCQAGTLGLVSTIWFKPSVFQTDKEIQRCAGGAQLRKGSFNCLC
jgi:hypothetical protein